MPVILQNILYKVQCIFFSKAVSTTCLKFDLDLSGDVFPRHSGDIVHGSSSNLPCLRGSHDWTGATYVPSRQERGEGDEINTADAILPLSVATVTLRLLLWIWDYSHFETSKLPIWDNYYQFETTITSLKLLLPLLLLHLFPPAWFSASLGHYFDGCMCMCGAGATFFASWFCSAKCFIQLHISTQIWYDRSQK